MHQECQPSPHAFQTEAGKNLPQALPKEELPCAGYEFRIRRG